MNATTTAPIVEIDRTDDSVYVHVDGEFAASIAPRYGIGDGHRVVAFGYFVFDERDTPEFATGRVRTRIEGEALVAHRLGVTLPTATR